eukprot:scaffold8557_cov100-Skeletonema_dohrnii-CCMP3373.AAC.10
MVGFGSSLRMSRRRGWEDAYLDYASLRLLLTQIEAVYEEEDWKARDSAAAANNNGGAYFEEGAHEDYHHEDEDMMEEDHDDDGHQVITNSSYSYMPSVFLLGIKLVVWLRGSLYLLQEEQMVVTSTIEVIFINT